MTKPISRYCVNCGFLESEHYMPQAGSPLAACGQYVAPPKKPYKPRAANVDVFREPGLGGPADRLRKRDPEEADDPTAEEKNQRLDASGQLLALLVKHHGNDKIDRDVHVSAPLPKKGNHTYPSNYKPGSHWAITTAWQILDTLPVGLLNDNQRVLMAGMITGALMKVHDLAKRTS